MKNISIKELNDIICGGGILAGKTVTYGKNVYRIDKLDNGVSWICYMPYESYRSNIEEYDNSSIGCCAFMFYLYTIYSVLIHVNIYF